MRNRFTALLCATAALLGACAPLGLGEEDAGSYTITADVEQAPNLFEGGRVTIRGVEVGRIVDVEPREDFVRLTLEIEGGIAVPDDASLSVIPITVIADRYAQLHPAYKAGPLMEDGDHIPLARTAIPAELDQVITQLQGLLESIEPKGEGKGPLARLITNLDQALNDPDDLAGALDKSATVLQNLAHSDAEIGGLIRNLDRLFIALADRTSEIGLINQRFRLVARSLLADQVHLEGTIEDVAFLSDETAGLVSRSGDDLGEAFQRLARVMEELLSHQEALTEGTRWTNVIAQALGAVDGSGKGLYAYSGRQVPPGSPGSEYNYRIDQRDTISCERLNNAANIFFALQDPTQAELIKTLNEYLPDTYHEELRFLLRALIPLCVDEFQDDPSSADSDEPTPAERALLRRARRVLGKEKLERFLVRWAFGGGK